jgi:hypothetical protein
VGDKRPSDKELGAVIRVSVDGLCLMPGTKGLCYYDRTGLTGGGFYAECLRVIPVQWMVGKG